jgi:hypothetical protein
LVTKKKVLYNCVLMPSFSTPPLRPDDDDDDVTPADRILRGLPGSSSDEDSDSDARSGLRPVRKLRRSDVNRVSWFPLLFGVESFWLLIHQPLIKTIDLT